jgi:hypothetical protein
MDFVFMGRFTTKGRESAMKLMNVCRLGFLMILSFFVLLIGDEAFAQWGGYGMGPGMMGGWGMGWFGGIFILLF